MHTESVGLIEQKHCSQLHKWSLISFRLKASWELMKKAYEIGLIPQVVKGAFGVGGRYVNGD